MNATDLFISPYLTPCRIASAPLPSCVGHKHYFTLPDSIVCVGFVRTASKNPDPFKFPDELEGKEPSSCTAKGKCHYLLSHLLTCALILYSYLISDSVLVFEEPTFLIIELHNKLWGRDDLFPEVFRAVDLTKQDFIELQSLLHYLNPS